MTSPERDQPREKGVVAWERPTLTLLGDVKDLIHASVEGSLDPSKFPFGSSTLTITADTGINPRSATLTVTK